MVRITDIVFDPTVSAPGPPDPEAELVLNASSYQANENDSLSFTIERIGNLNSIVDIDWAFTNASVNPILGTERFQLGIDSILVTVTTLEVGPTEIGDITISNIQTISGNVNNTIGSLSTATVTIVDSDAISWPVQTVQGLAVRNRTGFGMETKHAYTGGNPTIIHVTNLNAVGAGSFKEAFESVGNRIIVFDVGGVIDANGADIQNADKHNFWIAGQTAPAPGITILDDKVRFTGCEDFLVQHIRFQVSEDYVPPGGDPQLADCIAVEVGNNPGIRKTGPGVFHHVEVIGGFDESIGMFHGTFDIDFIECIVSFPIVNPTNPGGTGHAFGPLTRPKTVAGNPEDDYRWSMQGCLLSHMEARCPRCAHPFFMFSNNLIYDWDFTGLQLFKTVGSGDINGVKSNVIGNRFKPGSAGFPNNNIQIKGWGTVVGGGAYDGVSKVWLDDNSDNGVVPGDQFDLVTNNTAFTKAQILAGAIIIGATPNGFVAWSNDLDMENYLIVNIGCRPKTRTFAGQRAITNYQNDVTIPGPDKLDFLKTPLDYTDQNLVPTNEVFIPVANPHDTHPTESDYTNLQVQLLDLGESL